MAATYNYGAAPTYVKIASQTLSNASTVTFSNIPQGYTDLKVIFSGNNVNATGYSDIKLTINGDTGSNYSRTGLSGNGSAAVSSRNASQSGPIYVSYDFHIAGQNGMSNMDFNFMGYSNQSVYKSILFRGNTSLTETKVEAMLWKSLNPITTLTFDAITYNWASGTTFTLYGIKAAFVPKASGGDIVVNDGTYWYHAFRTTGAFVPKQTITADVLVVAGGGAGGGNPTGNNYGASGGGGAGGVFYATSQSLTSGTSYTSTVGAGGVGDAGVNSNGLSGSNSVFGSLTAAVGGGGGRSGYGNGANGGSGGGGGGLPSAVSSSTQTGTGGTGYGYGSLFNASYYAGAGGGGAGGVGAAAVANQSAGAGGVGLNTWSTWLSTTGLGVSGYIAGGGGGGGSPAYGTVANASGGSGGGGAGGNGGTSNTPVSGAANTGGGGGGAGAANNVAMATITGGSGGSGLIIVRYAV